MRAPLMITWRPLCFLWITLIGCASPDPSSSLGGSDPRVVLTVTSLSPGGQAHATLLSMIWVYDEGQGDQATSVGTTTFESGPLPRSVTLHLGVPAHYWVDFDRLRALPDCTDPSASSCWDTTKGPRPAGKGKMAIGAVAVFEDADDNKEYTRSPSDPLRGVSPYYLLYVKDLDAQAIETLGRLMLLNPGALKPGFNVAQVRCRKKVGWTGEFDPFEIVDPSTPLIIESKEANGAREQAEEICRNWT
jgi:hypothetical protein